MAQDPFDRFFNKLQKPVVRAAVRALNKAATSVRAEAAKRIRAQLKLKSADIKDAITIKKAVPQSKIGVDGIASALVVEYKPVPLVKFNARTRRVQSARGPRRGVTVQVKGQRKLVEGAFLATTKRGYTGIFKRTGPKIAGKRQKIRQLYSTAVAEFFGGEGFLAELRAYARTRVQTIFGQELNYEMSKELDKAAAKKAKGS